MLKNPIPQVTNKLQYRAIGIVNGKFIPKDSVQLNRGFLIDNKGEKIETVILGKALSLLKKHIDLKKSYYWVVYPKNKNTQNLHLQVAGIWDPYKLNQVDTNVSEKDPDELLDELNLNNNFFSIRGELVYVNSQKKEIVIKICSSRPSKKLKDSTFKIIVEGEISLKFLKNFVSLDVIRDGNILRMVKYEIIEKIQSKKS